MVNGREGEGMQMCSPPVPILITISSLAGSEFRWLGVVINSIVLTAFSWLIFIYGLIDAFMRKQQAADNPWGAGATTLEWTLPSPPPFHQFEVLPRVQ